MTWRTFEQKVRDLGSLKYNRVATKENISGVDLDCVLKISNDQWVIIEITRDKKLEKIRTDLNRIELVRRQLYDKQRIMTTCFCVCDFDPTPAMKEAGSGLHVQVLSATEFERQVFDYRSYYNNRRKLQFGSAVNALTGKPDDSSFVPVAYEFRSAGEGQGIERISKLILANKKVILLGEYGTGKSRCLKELFSYLNDDHETMGYFFCIDLRLTWGLQSGAEIVRRHLDLLGLSENADNIVRAFNQGLIFFLLDGFDEVGSQSWSDKPHSLAKHKI